MIGEAEEWRVVPGFENYSVSSFGRVRRDRVNSVEYQDRLLSQQDRADGRLSVSLSKPGTRKNFKVHVIVAAAFLGPRPNGYEVAHNNGDCLDNRASNLRYATRAENVADIARHGKVVRGERHGMCKLRDDDVSRIVRLRQQGLTNRQVAVQFGIHRNYVSVLFNSKKRAGGQNETA